jgi:hypothetical protein
MQCNATQCNASDSQCQSYQVPTTTEEEGKKAGEQNANANLNLNLNLTDDAYGYACEDEDENPSSSSHSDACFSSQPTTHMKYLHITYELMTITTFRRILGAQQTSSSSNAGIPRSEFEHFVGQASSGPGAQF